MDKRSLLFTIGIGLSAIGCAVDAPLASGEVQVSRRAREVGVSSYDLQQRSTTDVLLQYSASGTLLATLESNRATGAATQTWVDPDHNTWEIASATGCLSRNGVCLGDTKAGARASGVQLPDDLVAQAARAAASKIDLNAYLFPSNPNPYTTSTAAPPGVPGPHNIAAERSVCVTTPDILCSTASYCWAMGGDSNCGWISTTCCFSY